MQLLLDDKVPVGLIEGPARERGVRREPFMEDELVLVTPREFEPDSLTPSQFRASKLLLREHGSGSRRVVDTALGKAGFKLKPFKKVMTFDLTEAIKSAVETGLGVGFVSRWASSKELELGTLKVAQVNGLRVTRHFTLTSRAGPNLVGPASALRTFALGRARLLSNKPRRSLQAAAFESAPDR